MVRDGGVKKKKDPNAPKRPTTAFFMWMQENRERLKKPGMKACDVAKAAGVEWGTLTDKTKWEQLADADKKRYETQIAEYRRTHPEPPRQPPQPQQSHHSQQQQQQQQQQAAAASAAAALQMPINYQQFANQLSQMPLGSQPLLHGGGLEHMHVPTSYTHTQFL